MKKNNILTGAFILIVASVFCKVLGAVSKIPINNILTTKGVGMYQLIFPLYSLLLVISSSGIPIAVSKLVANSSSVQKNHEIVKIALKTMLKVSIIGALLIILFNNLISSMQGNVELGICYVIIAPSVVFVSLISVFRGYFQGLNFFKQTAISQIVEQTIKIVVSLVLAFLLISFGIIYAVIGAVVGITISELFALVYLYVSYKLQKRKFKGERINLTEIEINEIKQNFRKNTITITLTAVVLPILLSIDSVLYINLLKLSGVSAEMATSYFGIETGIVGTLLNLPIILSVSLSNAIIPSLKYEDFTNEPQKTRQKCKLAFKVVFWSVIPCVVVFLLFAKPILMFLYGNILSANSVLLKFSELLLSLTGIEMIFVSFVQISVAILQAKNLEREPLKIMLISGLIKILASVLLLFIPGINIYSISISTILFYVISFAYLYVKVAKSVGIKFYFFKEIYSPIVSSFFAGLMALLIYKNNPTIPVLMFAFVVFALIYVLLTICLGFVSRQEFKRFSIIKFRKSIPADGEVKEVAIE